MRTETLSASRWRVDREPPNQRLKLTGAAILVFRASLSLQAAPAAYQDATKSGIGRSKRSELGLGTNQEVLHRVVTGQSNALLHGREFLDRFLWHGPGRHLSCVLSQCNVFKKTRGLHFNPHRTRPSLHEQFGILFTSRYGGLPTEDDQGDGAVLQGNPDLPVLPVLHEPRVDPHHAPRRHGPCPQRALGGDSGDAKTENGVASVQGRTA